MESSKEIQIKVKTLNSTTLPFKIYTHETVGGLKNKIFQKIRISTLNQRLIYQGKVLKNEKTISDYKLDDNDVIHLVETDNRNYQAPPTSSISSSTNPYISLFNSIFNSHPTNDNNNTTRRLNPSDTEGIHDSFKHILFPNTFNLQQTTEIITQSMNSIYNLIDTSNFLNFDNSTRIKNLYQNSISGIDFKVGQWIDVRDQNLHWVEGQIIEIKEREVKVHYIGTSSRLNEWINLGSERLALFRTYTCQENKRNDKYSSPHPNKSEINVNDAIYFTQVKKFSCINNDLLVFIDLIKEKITKILNQREVIKLNRFESKDDLFNNERYEMLMIMQLYPLLDRFGRLLIDIAYYLMNTSFNHYTDNLYLFRKNIYDETLRFMNIYDSSETVMKNRLEQYQNLTKYSIIRPNPESTFPPSENQQPPRIGYIVNFHSFSRTREEEREEQMRRARRFIVSRTEETILGNSKKYNDGTTQTENPKKFVKYEIDKLVEIVEYLGNKRGNQHSGEKKEFDKIINDNNINKRSIVKEKVIIEAKNKNMNSTSINMGKKAENGKNVRYRVNYSKGKMLNKK